MLKDLTAYRITETNAHLLSILSGKPKVMFTANLGWYAGYSEMSYPRWELFPKSYVTNIRSPYVMDEETYP